MKPLMILGSLVGFVTGAGFSLAGNCPWPTVFWRACVGALLVGVLARWWSRIWLDGLQSAIENQRNPRPTPKSETKIAVKS
jgi:uncharacterized membrane protein YjjB (DUF3815 family)